MPGAGCWVLGAGLKMVIGVLYSKVLRLGVDGVLGR
jgi:hypothetical protein